MISFTLQELHRQLDETRAKYCILGANPFFFFQKKKQLEKVTFIKVQDNCAKKDKNSHRKSNLFPSYPQVAYEPTS